MGAGIAQVGILAGFECLLYDLDPAVRTRAGEIIQNNLNIGIQKGKVSKEQVDRALTLLKFPQEIEEVSAEFIIDVLPDLVAPDDG